MFSTAEAPALQNARRKRVWLLPAVLALLAAAALWVDVPLSRWCMTGECPGWIRKSLELAEVFGHGIGVAMIIGIAFVLDPRRRWGLPRVGGCVLAAGLAANALKMLVIRSRPLNFQADDVLSSFGVWLPWASGGFSGQSFPSAHTAAAVAFAFALAWLYPRGRFVFPLLAAMVAAQRVDHSVHFLSDVLAGAAVGAIIAPLFFTRGGIGRAFDDWETRWRSQAGEPLPDESPMRRAA